MRFRGWRKVDIRTDDGSVRPGIAPLIISASRSTDIPVFYAEWLLRRLRAGYVRWINPFNGTSQYVSLENVRFIVFWTKNPEPAKELFDYLDTHAIGYYVQITLNDYERENLEPFIPDLDTRIGSFCRLSEKLGNQRVLWRFDPLIRTATIDIDELLRRIDLIARRVHNHTTRLTISFMEHYRKVTRNLQRAGIEVLEFTREEMERLAAGLATLNRSWGLDLVACAEERDLSRFGVGRASCVDADLIATLRPNDEQLIQFLESGTVRDLFGRADRRAFKDTGQRELCGCLVSKDIGTYDTCPHACAYCYANTTSARAIANARRSGVGECLLG